MKKKQPGIAVIVPCYNEEARLPVLAIARFLQSQPHYRFVMVDDGSEDDTLGRFEALQSAVNEIQVHIVALPRNCGKAEATRQGLLYALSADFAHGNGIEWLGYLDADLATPLSELQELVRIGCEDSEVQAVLGSRLQLAGRRIERNRGRWLVSRVFGLVTSSLFRLQIKDTQCGAKLFRNRAWLSQVCRQPFSDRWLFDVELLVRIRQVFGNQFFRVVFEYPLREWRDASGSRLKLSDFALAPIRLLKMAARYWLASSVQSEATPAGPAINPVRSMKQAIAPENDSPESLPADHRSDRHAA